MSIIIITHDLGVVANMCDKIVVMYGGKIVETDQHEIFDNPNMSTPRVAAAFQTLTRRTTKTGAH